MHPSARLDRVFDSYAWVEYFRGTSAGEVVADELDAGLGGTPLVVVAELRDKYVRADVPLWSKDFACLKEATALGPEDGTTDARTGETRIRMRAERRRPYDRP